MTYMGLPRFGVSNAARMKAGSISAINGQRLQVVLNAVALKAFSSIQVSESAPVAWSTVPVFGMTGIAWHIGGETYHMIVKSEELQDVIGHISQRMAEHGTVLVTS
jgi:hypothetical protein